MENYYDLLEISINSSQQEIKKAFNKKVKQWHPDKFVSKSHEEQEQAEEITKKLNEAKEILLDENEKAKYDEKIKHENKKDNHSSSKQKYHSHYNNKNNTNKQRNTYSNKKQDSQTKKKPPADFIFIKGGTFMMGSPMAELERRIDETQHEVKVSTFYMSKYEVTQAEYESIMGNNPIIPGNFKGKTLPMVMVSWYDAVRYCNERSRKEGLIPAYIILRGDNVTQDHRGNGYRLPTEAEWEYACRAGTTTPFNTGENITVEQANYNGCYPYNGNAPQYCRGTTIPVGKFEPNALGLHDMHGNVREWCWDRYGNYSVGTQLNPYGPNVGEHRVVRGGSWSSCAHTLRSAYRHHDDPSHADCRLGFRLVLDGK